MKLADGVAIESIALFETTGNVIIDLGATQLQTVPQQAGGGDAVDVVVTVDRNPPS